MSSSGRESSRWPELAALRALMAAGRELRAPRQPGWRGGRDDHAALGAGANGKTAKVMHLLLWGPK